MRYRKSNLSPGYVRFAGAVLAVALLTLTPAASPGQTSDAVEALRASLKAPVESPTVREAELRARIAALKSISDLRRALLLTDWRDEDLNLEITGVDRTCRDLVARRFALGIRQVLARGDVPNCLAVANMLGDLGRQSETLRLRPDWLRGHSEDLAGLVQHPDATVQEAAARALGRIHGEPHLAVPAFHTLLARPEANLRAAGAEGLAELTRAAGRALAYNGDTRSQLATRADVIRTCCAAAPEAGRGLTDAQPEVRRHCVTALAQAASLLGKFAVEGAAVAPTGAWAGHAGDLRPLMLTLKDQAPALTRALDDADAYVRVTARHALEDLARVHGDRPGSPIQPVAGAGSGDDAGRRELLARLPELTRALADADVRGRLAAVDVLEALGPAAAPAAPALVGALGDSDRFVRWAAVRTLGRLAPVAAATAVPAIARLLTDTDLDLRLAAMAALERYGEAAQPAVPALTDVLAARDVEARLAAVRALQAVGPRARSAVPALVKALADADARLRVQAAQALAGFGAAAREAIPALQKALSDRDAEVRQAAADALLAVSART